jgi:hypothetical protein
MKTTILTEHVGPAHHSGIVATICRVQSLQERDVDRQACLRLSQSRSHRRHRPEYHSSHVLNHPSLLAPLLHRGVVCPRRRYLIRDHPAIRSTCSLGCGLRLVGLEQRRLVRRLVVDGQQVEHPTLGPGLSHTNRLLDALGVTRPRHHGKPWTARRVGPHVIPPVPPVGVGQVAAGGVPLLLEDERLHLIVLDLTSVRGRTLPTRRGVAGHGRRPGGFSGLLLSVTPSPAVKSLGLRFRDLRLAHRQRLAERSVARVRQSCV